MERKPFRIRKPYQLPGRTKNSSCYSALAGVRTHSMSSTWPWCHTPLTTRSWLRFIVECKTCKYISMRGCNICVPYILMYATGQLSGPTSRVTYIVERLRCVPLLAGRMENATLVSKVRFIFRQIRRNTPSVLIPTFVIWAICADYLSTRRYEAAKRLEVEAEKENLGQIQWHP